MLIPCFAIMFNDLYSKIKLPLKTKQQRVNLVLSAWSGPLLVVFMTAIIIGSIWADFISIRMIMKELYQPPKDYSPVMEYLKTGYPDGNLLNDYEWGDYLLYGLNPPPKVFIDGRADMYGEKIFSDYGKMAQLEKETDELIDEYRIDWILFPKDHILVRYLGGCKGWKYLFRNDDVEILARE